MAGTPCIETVGRTLGKVQVLAWAGAAVAGSGMPVSSGSLLTRR
jgi:hypothetical protein